MDNKHVGEINTNKYGETFKIIKYISYNDVIIEFLNNAHYIKHTRYAEFKNGHLVSPYAKRTFGIGYLGEGKYNFTDKNNLNKKGHAKHTKCYEIWASMLYRCYIERHEHNAYINCSVCDEWHNYQNFAEWFYKNYYIVDNEKVSLDKDIIIKNNTIYSPDTCCFVPSFINGIFVKREKNKDFDTPIGIEKNIHGNKYSAKIKKYNKIYTLGSYNTIEDAFNVYKIEKEKYIKEIADKYKDKIPKKVYDAMYNYQVEITD